MIGHLQRNKIKYIIDKVDLIHSVDSLRLAEAIEKEAAKKHVIAKVLIEVNVGREESKFGFLPEELDDFVEKASDFSHIQFMGLMTSAPFVDNPEENRPIFAELRKLSVDIARKNAHNMSMSILSMGMTNDYEVAIEEGALSDSWSAFGGILSSSLQGNYRRWKWEIGRASCRERV